MAGTVPSSDKDGNDAERSGVILRFLGKACNRPPIEFLKEHSSFLIVRVFYECVVEPRRVGGSVVGPTIWSCVCRR